MEGEVEFGLTLKFAPEKECGCPAKVVYYTMLKESVTETHPWTVINNTSHSCRSPRCLCSAPITHLPLSSWGNGASEAEQTSSRSSFILDSGRDENLQHGTTHRTAVRFDSTHHTHSHRNPSLCPDQCVEVRLKVNGSMKTFEI